MEKIYIYNKVCAALLLLLTTAPLVPSIAADGMENTALADGETDRLFNLDDVVVTGTRTPKLLKDVPILTRLITEEEIRKSDATDIRDLLQQEMPGVEFTYAMNPQFNTNLPAFAGQNPLTDDSAPAVQSLTVQVTAARDEVLMKEITVYGEPEA